MAAYGWERMKENYGGWKTKSGRRRRTWFIRSQPSWPSTNGTMWIGTEGDGVYEFNGGVQCTSGHKQRAVE